MSNMYLIILFLVIFFVLVIVSRKKQYKVYINDIDYLYNVKNTNWVNMLDNNRILNPEIKKSNILIITYDNRTDIPYLIEHNKNINEYVKKWNYEYKFLSKCNENVYWCKIYLLLDELNTNKYDYVMWMDSDTYIKNMDVSLDSILSNYSSDIYIGLDKGIVGSAGTNAGVFIIKNSETGKEFLNACIKNFNKKDCINKNKLNGMWAATCYEQGIMNKLIIKKYNKYTTILSKKYISNTEDCEEDVFILHNMNQTSDNRYHCFIGQPEKIKNKVL